MPEIKGHFRNFREFDALMESSRKAASNDTLGATIGRWVRCQKSAKPPFPWGVDGQTTRSDVSKRFRVEEYSNP